MQADESKEQKPPILNDLSRVRIALPINCAWCSYDLKGLTGDVDCPECGQPVRLSIFETIDPAAKKLYRLPSPKVIGNMLPLIVSSFFISVIGFLVAALLSNTQWATALETSWIDFPMQYSDFYIFGLCFASLTFLFTLPIIKVNKDEHLEGCNQGIRVICLGSIGWLLSVLIAFVYETMGEGMRPGLAYIPSMVVDTVFPAAAVSILFVGFKMFIPRIGNRSRVFRQSQVSRQRMNDLLFAIIVVCFGRLLIASNPVDSNAYYFGTIILTMGMALVFVGLGYTVWNTLWIRKSLISPPPSIQELIRPID